MPEHERPNCFFIGSSMVYRSLDPVVVEEAFELTSGQTLNCFNFGVQTLSASGAEILIEYLHEYYDPLVIIYGVTPRAFNPFSLTDSLSAKKLFQLDWVTYQRGTFSVEGWLTTYSQIYRYYLAYQDWPTPNIDKELTQRNTRRTRVTQGDGFSPKPGILTLPLSSTIRAKYTHYYENFRFAQTEIEEFTRLLSLHTPDDLQLVIVEIPLHDTFVDTFLGRSVFDDYQTEITAQTQAHDVLYLTDVPPMLRNDANHYADATHMNVAGATIFSRWLGTELGTAVRTERLVLSGAFE